MQIPPLPNPKQWLKNAEAAEALAVTAWTIKRWMRSQDTCKALSAVRHGKQWRIPRPDDLPLWEYQTRDRLKKLGIECKEAFELELEKLGKQHGCYALESYRLWLAAYGTVLERGRITQKARDAILQLWQVAGKILAPLPRYNMEVDRLKSQFPAGLLARHFHRVLAGLRCCSVSDPLILWLIVAALLDVKAVMHYWPNPKHFELVHDADTLVKLEPIRRRLDYKQAVRDLKHLGKKPTTKNIGPLLHKDMMAHINDTREQLPGIVVKNPTGEEMRRITMASVCDQIAGKKPLLVTFDLRLPQHVLARRTVQKRHPQKKYPQKIIVARVYRIRPDIPGADKKDQTGKTLIRNSKYDDDFRFRGRFHRVATKFRRRGTR